MPAELVARPRAGWLVVASAFVAALLLLHVSALSVRVSGASMSPYAGDGAMLLVNTVAPVSRGDVVVAHTPEGWNAGAPERIVKRVVAVAGDRISCCDKNTGSLVLNGQPLDEPYVADASDPSATGFDVVVPEGHVWLLGDNRAVSLDSREHVSDGLSGAVPRASILGVVWWRLPF
ncbi:signal peptidase I [Leifsonia sp. AK011]|uniref:signal peptidase I n=1 Tax=Leifsonia sp. AK011 TaxID=2723075 RepID=UPI0015C770BE|nr:signal peptidase I [Leifsonia sp. AK011]NYF09141.1 signal peptidase I [Leifsonia sp. AK011]